MSTFEPTPQQFTILDAIASHTHPVIAIDAGPGCAKTTTIKEAIKLLAPNYKSEWVASRARLVYTAFNKDICMETQADFVAEGINKNGLFKAQATTFNSLGLSIAVMGLEPGTKVSIDANKSKAILRGIQDQGRHSIAPDEWDDLTDLLKMAKSQGYLPPASGSAFGSLLDFETLAMMSDVIPKPHYKTIIDIALKATIKSCFDRLFDFDDQLWFTAFFSPMNRKIEWMFVDECQDLTPVQLFLLKRIKASWIVLVGDPCQAIYAFRGAMNDSFERIFDIWPGALRLPLTESFRVPKNVLPLLRERNAALSSVSPANGLVDTWQGGTIRDLIGHVKGTRAILCRNNAPLYRVALACIASQIPFMMNDTRWGESLIKSIKRVCPNPQSHPVDSIFIGMFMHSLLEYAGDDKRKRDAALDKVAAVEALADATNPSSVAALLLTLQSLLKRANPSDKNKPLLLSTAHKAKGLEFDYVVHLDSHLIPAQYAETESELAQEANIAYVINSRTKSTLVFAESASIIIPGAPTPRRRPDIRRNQPL